MLLGALAVGTLTPTRAAAQGLTVSGYGDMEMWVKNLGSDSKEFTFDNHHVNLILTGAITDNIFVATELEYEHAGSETAFEYGYMGYDFGDTRIIGGKFLLPFGRFNMDLHPTPLNKIPERPLGFKNVMPAGYADVGVWLQGAKAINDESRVTYDLYAVNGRTGEDGAGIRGMRGNPEDVDNDKAIGGRLGFELPFQGLDFGASFYTGKYGVSDSGADLRITMTDLDAQYMKDGFSLRGEYVHASQDASGGDLTKSGGWVQAAYWVNARVEPVVRFGTLSMPGESSDAKRLSMGVSFQVSPASIFRVAFMRNMEKSGFKKENDVFMTQFNVIF